jgi:hypothetical protein
MKIRWKIRIAVGIVLGVAILISVIHHYQLRAATESYIAELKAKGEPMELSQVIPPPVPPEKNSAPFFLKAAALLTTNYDDVLNTNPPFIMHQVAPGKAVVSWEQSEIRDPGMTNSWWNDGMTNSWQDIQKALQRNAGALNLLVQLTNSSLFDFNLQYDQGFDMRLTHLSLEKKSAQRLAIAAIYNLHLGDANLAADNIRAIFVLVNGTHDERTDISQLVRISIAQIGIAATWEFLQSPNPTDKNLTDLQAAISRMEFVRAEINTLPVEREGGEATLAKWRSSYSEFSKYFDLRNRVREAMGNPVDINTFWNESQFKTKVFLWRYWWSYPDELRSLKGYEVLMNTTRSIEANGSFRDALSAQTNALDKLGISKLNSSLDSFFSGGEPDFHSLISGSIMTLNSVTRRVMEVEVAKQAALTAIALKRYQLKYKNYPQNLEAIVPEFIPAVPNDPVDGQPLRYRRNADGTFLLYSVGENGKDDGGDPSLEKGSKSLSLRWLNPDALDWVWPQPATASEIQKYYEGRPKNSIDASATVNSEKFCSFCPKFPL